QVVTHRELLVVALLRLRADGGPSAAREGVRGDDGSVPIQTHATDCRLRHSGLRCTCWMRSLDELSRCLRLMRNGGRSSHSDEWTDEAKLLRRQWSAVHERYVAAERRP